VANRKSPPPAPEYTEALRTLYALRRFGMRPGLETIRALLHALDDPQRAFRAVHVAGSKGKGSTAALTESILRAAGRTTGLFTSPHLASYRERIRIDGEPIAYEAVVDGLSRVTDAAETLRRRGALEHEPTFFETTTALGFQHFARSHVDAAVVEVGLGGRLDSTNVLDAPVAVLSTLELEHTEILGPTILDIAREKAGILHPGQHALLGVLPPSARAEVDRRAYAAGIPAWHLGEELRISDRTLSPKGQRFDLELPTRSVERVAIPLYGTFQPSNAALAVAAADRFAGALDFSLSANAIRQGARSVVWRGRLERVDTAPDLFLDVAHTPESARRVAESLGEISPFNAPEDSAILFGCLEGKRIAEILAALEPIARTLVIVPVSSGRSAAPAEIRRIATGRFPRLVQAGGAVDGLRLARAATGEAGLTLVLGSDYLVGEILREREGSGVGEPDLSDPGLGGSPAPAESAKVAR
jgi:dihydrofolate synthase / folylpolyglutamate synthase